MTIITWQWPFNPDNATILPWQYDHLTLTMWPFYHDNVIHLPWQYDHFFPDNVTFTLKIWPFYPNNVTILPWYCHRHTWQPMWPIYHGNISILPLQCDPFTMTANVINLRFTLAMWPFYPDSQYDMFTLPMFLLWQCDSCNLTMTMLNLYADNVIILLIINNISFYHDHWCGPLTMTIWPLLLLTDKTSCLSCKQCDPQTITNSMILRL